MVGLNLKYKTMELNKEIHNIILEGMELAQQENWSVADRYTRAVYDTFRIQNIINSTIPVSYTMFMGKYKKDFENYCKNISKSKESIIKHLKKIGVYDDDCNIVENYRGKPKP